MTMYEAKWCESMWTQCHAIVLFKINFQGFQVCQLCVIEIHLCQLSSRKLCRSPRGKRKLHLSEIYFHVACHVSSLMTSLPILQLLDFLWNFFFTWPLSFKIMWKQVFGAQTRLCVQFLNMKRLLNNNSRLVNVFCQSKWMEPKWHTALSD